MKNTAYTITGSGAISACIEGQIFTIDPSHPNYPKALDAVKESNWTSFLDLVDLSRKVKHYLHQFGGQSIEINDGAITFNGEIIHNTLTDRVISFMQKDLPFKPLLNFMVNLMKNPSNRAVNELYTFLEVGKLPLTEDGHFLAFKNVRNDYKDIHSGKFDNSVGKVCEMRRNAVCDDKDQTCSTGLHFCSIDYLPHFSDANGGKTMILKINPADVVSIPADYNNTKGRTCKYEVIAEYTDNWRERIGRDNGFDSELYSSDGGEYEGDEEEEAEICDHCSEDLNDENYDGNGDHLCTTCYDEEYSGCCGGGCSGRTTNEDEEKPRHNESEQYPTNYNE